MPVRCHECKAALGGRHAGRNHAKLAGHKWQPGSCCISCEAAFSSHTARERHQSSCKKADVPASSPMAPTVRSPASVTAGDTDSEHDTRSQRTSVSEVQSCSSHPDTSSDADAPVPVRETHKTQSAKKGKSPKGPSAWSRAKDGAKNSPAQRPARKAKCYICELEFSSKRALLRHAITGNPDERCSTRAIASLYEQGRLSMG
ncbi:hypothetical protein OH77DRAFT_1422728 [Trametes cingulata]|nr:hypothetical protein OH77DRAFT_1422728 [Trametes cingulata]